MSFSSAHQTDVRPSTHGHNYELEVTLRGDVDLETGMVMDLKQLRDVMESVVGSTFDHRHLDRDTSYFDQRPSTAENFATVVFDLLDGALPSGALHRVRLSPDEDLTVEVSR